MPSKLKKIFLVSGAQVQYSRPPAALAFMAGVCERNQVEYELIDLNIAFMHTQGEDVWNQCYPYSNNDLEQMPKNLANIVDNFLDSVIQQIKASGADCVALTLLSYVQQQWAHRFLKRLKHQHEILTIAGGPGISVPYTFGDSPVDSFGRCMVKYDLLDYYVMGEGDIIFDQFISGQRELPGLNSKHASESWQPQIDDLNALPIPSYKNIDFDLYRSPDKVPMISLTGSRGCVRRCTFCDVGHLWKKFRYRSGQNIADEMLKHYHDTGIENFWFNDSLINGSLKQFYELMETLVKHKINHGMNSLNFSGQFIIRPRSSHPEKMFQLMNATGCNQLQIGVEAGSESVRAHMGKKFSNEDIDYHFEMCEKYNIKNWLLMIVGYPTETERDFQDTLDMLRRYQKYLINDTMLGLNLKSTLVFLPNTPLESMKEELGIYHVHNDPRPENWLSHSNPELTTKQRYLRWVRATRLAIELGYNLPCEIPADLVSNRRIALELNNIKLNDSYIPLVTESQISVYS